MSNLTQSQTNTTAISTKLNQSYILLVGLLATTFVQAADLQGGLDNTTETLSTIQTSIIALVGILAGLYLLYVAVQCWGGKQEWTAMIPAIIKVAVAGGAVTAAGWAFSLLA